MKIVVVSGDFLTNKDEYLYAKDYVSAIDDIVNHDYLTDDFEFEPLFSGTIRTIEEVLGKDWISVLKGWNNIRKFNNYFDGYLYLREVDVPDHLTDPDDIADYAYDHVTMSRHF